MNSYKITKIEDGKVTVEFTVNDVKQIEVLDSKFLPMQSAESLEAELTRQLMVMSVCNVEQVVSQDISDLIGEVKQVEIPVVIEE